MPASAQNQSHSAASAPAIVRAPATATTHATFRKGLPRPTGSTRRGWALGTLALSTLALPAATIHAQGPGQDATSLVGAGRGQPGIGVSAGISATLVPVAPGGRDVSPLFSDRALQPVDLRVPMDFAQVYAVVPDPAWRGNHPWTRGAGGRPWERSLGYRIDAGHPLDSARAEWFVRVSGGLVALFPRSSYVATRGGISAPIPPGTVFALGGIPRWAVGGASAVQETPTHAGASSVANAPGIGRAQAMSAGATLGAVRAVQPALARPIDRSAGSRPGIEEPQAEPDDSDDRGVPSLWTDNAYRARRLAALLGQ